ncbi:hypothetical protein FH972_020253 [Carpinus fangiana]|uniref:non-specific serine/threonine protein kinase n=1 Tax=Carpinus fangiana TaxID=176857 RepID=A0A5N6RSM0_9ROSI|nr:hypothetical protein FH972_020253 [Carpinus fangiana]
MKGSEQYWSSPLIDQLADIFMIDEDYLTWPSTNEIRRIRLDIYGNLLLETYGDHWFSLCLHYNNNISCTTTNTIRAGQSLNTSETIVSSNRRYELGFSPTEYYSVNYYYVGIRYYNVPGANVVWVADYSFLNSSAVLTLDSDGNLLTSDRNLTNISGDNETYARLLDTGNLVLKNRTSHILWQSFDHPTNTILPGMKVKDAKTGWSLTSRESYASPYPGGFSLQYLGSRKELILMEKSEAYWSSSLSGVLADIFVIDGDYITLRSNYTNIDIRRIWLDISGNLITESGTYGPYKSDNLTTSCGAYPACGEFSICKETADAVFKCDCLPGFKAYPDRGCMRNTYLSCSDGVQKDGFLRMSNVFLPTGHYGSDGENISGCESACLNRCSCIGYAYDHQEHYCLTWEGPALLKMRQFSEDNTYTKEFYLKLAHEDLVPKGISVMGDYYCFSGVFFL